MEKTVEVKTVSTIYQRLGDVRMTEADREMAISALSNAEVLVDAFAWLAKKIEYLSERLFLRPSLKH
ncbi:MAG: hypothetical protein ACXW2L_18775 [Burkholderiales bacterium]